MTDQLSPRHHHCHESIGKRANDTIYRISQKRGKSGLLLLEKRSSPEDIWSNASCNENGNVSYILDRLKHGHFWKTSTGNNDSVTPNYDFDVDPSHAQDCLKVGIHQLPENSAYKIKYFSKSNARVIFEDDPEGRRMCPSELSIVCTIQHEHITKLHAITCLPNMEPYVVIEKVAFTLEEKIRQWRHGCQHSDLRDRLCIFHALASALDFLHDRKIIYRGLEPCKVGFDGGGTVKLFDFSKAKRLLGDSGSFLLTAMTGSPLYIAPEVYRGEPYGFSVDVFSLCILVWEIILLEHICFGDASKYVETVLKQGQRPDIPSEWPLILRNILRYGWAKKPSTRPTIKVLHTALDQYLYRRSFDVPGMDYIQMILLSNSTFLEF